MKIPENQNKDIREGERIAKVMARHGLCSRRDAETWIAAGRVTVNGETLTSPAFNVGPDDNVRVDGEPLGERQRTRLYAFHKPKGLVTTSRDPEGRRTVFEALPPDLPRVVTIGRLDINTEGLLLLTNDGGLARVLELPETGWLRRYRVRAHGAIAQSQLDALKDGVTVEGVNYAGIEARLERSVGSNVWLTMGLREGKNREIKRVLEHLGLSVNRLIRVSFGPFELGDLPEGVVMEIPTRVLRDQLGARLAKKAEADFDAPIFEAPVKAAPAAAAVPRPLRRAPEGAAEVAQAAPVVGSADHPPRERGFAARPSREPRRPTGAPEPRKRKHISILRAEAREEAEMRRRTERSATKDRRGRDVKVERISTVRAREPEAARPVLADRPARPPRARAETGERKRYEVGAGERSARPPRTRPEGGERPRFGGKPDGDRPARPPRARAEAGERPRFGRKPDGDRPARPPRPRPESGERSRFGGKPAGDRPDRAPRPRSEGDARPPRKPSEGGRRPPPGGRPRPPGKRP
jgi:23S rRNA pseudouridine2605 synthase